MPCIHHGCASGARLPASLKWKDSLTGSTMTLRQLAPTLADILPVQRLELPAAVGCAQGVVSSRGCGNASGPGPWTLTRPVASSKHHPACVWSRWASASPHLLAIFELLAFKRPSTAHDLAHARTHGSGLAKMPAPAGVSGFVENWVRGPLCSCVKTDPSPRFGALSNTDAAAE